MDGEALPIALVGLAVLCANIISTVFRRFGVPALVGHLALGFLLGMAHNQWGLLSERARTAFEFLADLGVVALLFRVGLESRISTLLKKLPQATPIWLGNVGLAGARLRCGPSAGLLAHPGAGGYGGDDGN